MRTNHLKPEVAGGPWVTLRGERCLAYVVEAGDRPLYLTWCDDPHERTVEVYGDPVVALPDGRRRIAHADREVHESTGMEKDVVGASSQMLGNQRR